MMEYGYLYCDLFFCDRLHMRYVLVLGLTLSLFILSGASESFFHDQLCSAFSNLAHSQSIKLTHNEIHGSYFALRFVQLVIFSFMSDFISYCIISNGRHIEEFISLAMDSRDDDYDVEEEKRRTKKPNRIYFRRLFFTHAALAITQMIASLLGLVAGPPVFQDRSFGAFLGFMGMSMVTLSVFTLFSSSHQYASSMARCVLAQSVVLANIMLVGGRGGNIFSYLCQFWGLILLILIAIHIIWNPMDKLYNIYSERSLSLYSFYREEGVRIEIYEAEEDRCAERNSGC